MTWSPEQQTEFMLGMASGLLGSEWRYADFVSTVRPHDGTAEEIADRVAQHLARLLHR